MGRALLARLLAGWLGLCLCVCLCAGAGFASAQEGPYTHEASQLVFESTLGGIPRQGIRDYEASRPGLGVGVKYGLEDPKIYVDVYVYNAGRAVIPEGTGDPLVVAMFESAMSDIRQMGESGRYQNVGFMGNDSIPLGSEAGARSALRGRFEFTLDGADVYSHLYLLAVHNHFVKMRFTYRRDQAGAAQPLLGAALEGLGKVVGKNLQ
jgi:hypothetical protein